MVREPTPPPAPVISSEYGAEGEEDEEGDSDDEGLEAPPPPSISKQEVTLVFDLINMIFCISE